MDATGNKTEWLVSPARIVIIKKIQLAEPIEVGAVIFRLLYVITTLVYSTVVHSTCIELSSVDFTVVVILFLTTDPFLSLHFSNG